MTRQVQFSEIRNDRLTLQERQMLVLSLNTVLAGMGEVTVGFTYDKQTNTPPRIAGEDYVALPGVDCKVQLGQIVKVFRTQTEGALRFTIKSLSRADGHSPTGFTTIIPKGLRSFAITGFRPKAAAQTQKVQT